MTFKPLTPIQQRIHERYQNDLEYFCKNALKIKLKGGGEAPFVWNKAQRYLHNRIEDQLTRTGMVRMFILKGRQQGISTYIAARLYWKVTRQRGRNVFILSHHSTTTETLFNIVDKYHNACPPSLTPKVLTNNNRRMKFTNNSQYTVGTAGSGAIGRGDTNQYFHWSEVAFCDNIDELVTGVGQTVADVFGTEQFNESTANGEGNYFHRGCMAAMAGEGIFELTFIPWYWQDEYRAPSQPDFELTDEEFDIKDSYQLDNAQIQWRRNKIAFFKSTGKGEAQFKQEYPFTVAEAFQASGNRLFDADKVAVARKSKIVDKLAPLILGVDPGPINDRTAIAWRRGRELMKIERFMGLNQMALAGKLAQRIDRYDVAKVFIDVAEGRGCVDRLKELGYGDIAIGIPFAMSPTDDELYVNKRAEMAGELKEWIEDETGVSIPDEDEFQVELGVIPEFKTTSNGKRQLVPKDEIKKSYGRSPDLVDAVMLTFAQPVRKGYNERNRIRKAFTHRQSEMTTLNRRRPRNGVEEWHNDDPDGFTRSGPRMRKRR